MLEEFDSRRAEIEAACKALGVRRLELFGSAADPDRTAPPGDLDFLVDLGDAAPAPYADTYFRLREVLESLFGQPVDLVTERSVSNRYFREGIDRARRLLYAA